MAAVASREWVMERWGNLSSIHELTGKKILPMVLSVVSKSGICEPRIAKPKDKGLAVPRIKDVPAAAIGFASGGAVTWIHFRCLYAPSRSAIAAWVIAIIGGKGWSYFTSLSFGRAIDSASARSAIVSYLAHWGLNIFSRMAKLTREVFGSSR